VGGDRVEGDEGTELGRRVRVLEPQRDDRRDERHRQYGRRPVPAPRDRRGLQDDERDGPRVGLAADLVRAREEAEPADRHQRAGEETVGDDRVGTQGHAQVAHRRPR
jgi:hypothetical protein